MPLAFVYATATHLVIAHIGTGFYGSAIKIRTHRLCLLYRSGNLGSGRLPTLIGYRLHDLIDQLGVFSVPRYRRGTRSCQLRYNSSSTQHDAYCHYAPHCFLVHVPPIVVRIVVR
jgi:hypothetical protein